MDKHLNKYISKRYRHWLDYAKFQSNNGGIPSCAEDVLQEVLLQILSKGNEFVLDLYNIKKQGITALDFYVLNVIKTNAISETGRFKNLYKLRRNQINNNVDCSTVFEEIEKIKDEVYIDIPSDNDLILEKKHLLREAFKNVESKLNSLDSQLFFSKYFEDLDVKDIAEKYNITRPSVYSRLQKAVKIIKEELLNNKQL